MFKCSRQFCEKTFSFSNNKCRHEKTCRKGEILKPIKDKLVCKNEWCMKEFSKKSNLERHAKICRIKTRKVYNCSMCIMSFSKPSKLERHIKTHTAKPTYNCNNCFKQYTRKDLFEKHIRKCVASDDQLVVDLDERIEDVYSDEFFEDNFEESDRENGDVIMESEFRDSENEVTDIENEVSMFGYDVPQSNFEDGETVSNQPLVFKDNDETTFIIGEFGERGLSAQTSIENEIGLCTIKALKKLKHEAKRSSVKLQEFRKIRDFLFNAKKEDVGFLERVAIKLGFDSSQDFIKYGSNSSKKQGRPIKSITERQLMYDFWLSNSDLSNDRRNARHSVKIKPSKCDPSVLDLIDENIASCNTKRGQRLKAQRRIYSLPIRQLFVNLKRKHPELCSSFGAFYKCKPFYVSAASLREMEGCLCSKCLNPQVLFSKIRLHIKDMPNSLSDYLTQFFECSKDLDIEYPKLDCINGKCKNNCTIFDESKSSCIQWNEKITFYQFESIEETYFDKQGNKKNYNRVARKDYVVTLKEAYERLLEIGRAYLIHRHLTLLDKVYWNRFIEDTQNPIMWLDYSQNIKLTEKKQVQSAHFSGKQQTLHDSLIQWPDTSNSYIYHISDDTNHDSVLTNVIISQTIDEYPKLINQNKLILRSDNCSTQYKSRYVFKCLLDLAAKYSIDIYWFYGEAGHGRGLIDAMAWFGAKEPMRREIITNDAWFKNAAEMANFLTNHFSNDLSKQYFHVEEELTSSLRKRGREEKIVPGCKASHVIKFSSDGDSIMKWKTIKDFLQMEDDEDAVNEDDNDDDYKGDDDEEEEIEPEWSESIDDIAKHNFIQVDSFVAIRAPPGSVELFFLMRVKSKDLASVNMLDSSKEHSVLKGEPFLRCSWFSFVKEGRKFAEFKESTGIEDAVIHIGEVFATDVRLNEKHQMDIYDYKILVCSAV